jgi:hypothetical protein
MANTVTVNSNLTVAGIISSSSATFQVDKLINNQPDETIPVAKSGTLTTRTDNDTGVITSTAHGITASDTIAIFWTGGKRYDVDVTAVTDNTISFDLGSGDNLPSQDATVTVSTKVTLDEMFNGTQLRALAIGGSTASLFSFLDDSATPVSVFAVAKTAGEKFQWYGKGSIDNGYENPLTGHNITQINCYNQSTSAVDTLIALGGCDNVV